MWIVFTTCAMQVLPQERKGSTEWSANQLQVVRLPKHGAIDVLYHREIHDCFPLLERAHKVPMV